MGKWRKRIDLIANYDCWTNLWIRKRDTYEFFVILLIINIFNSFNYLRIEL